MCFISLPNLDPLKPFAPIYIKSQPHYKGYNSTTPTIAIKSATGTSSKDTEEKAFSKTHTLSVKS